jgi:hypothetical protein
VPCVDPARVVTINVAMFTMRMEWASLDETYNVALLAVSARPSTVLNCAFVPTPSAKPGELSRPMMVATLLVDVKVGETATLTRLMVLEL